MGFERMQGFPNWIVHYLRTLETWAGRQQLLSGQFPQYVQYMLASNATRVLNAGGIPFVWNFGP
jgi:hypothetical protein